RTGGVLRAVPGVDDGRRRRGGDVVPVRVHGGHEHAHGPAYVAGRKRVRRLRRALGGRAAPPLAPPPLPGGGLPGPGSGPRGRPTCRATRSAKRPRAPCPKRWAVRCSRELRLPRRRPRRARRPRASRRSVVCSWVPPWLPVPRYPGRRRLIGLRRISNESLTA